MKLRRPTETLCGCLWLPRFIDKIRHHFAGTLSPDFVQAFCHPLATDGIFLKHFSIEKSEVIERVRAHPSDEEVGQWFTSRPGHHEEQIAAWNRLGPQLGKSGYPGHRTFEWALKNLYGGCTDPRVDSVFTAIAWDEGYLEELTENSQRI